MIKSLLQALIYRYKNKGCGNDEAKNEWPVNALGTDEYQIAKKYPE